MSSSNKIVTILARKFLFSKDSDRFLSFITWVSVSGVALGVLALVTVTSVISGFEKELERGITGMHGDVIVYSRADPIENPERIAKKIKSITPELSAITEAFVTEIMISGPSQVVGSVLDGFEAASASKVIQAISKMKTGRAPIHAYDSTKVEIALGSALAEKLGAEVGGQVRLIAPTLGDEESSAPSAVDATVVGIFSLGMHQFDSKYAFVPLETLQRFLKRGNQVTSFKLKLNSGSDSAAVAAKINEELGYPFRAKDWAQLNKNLFYAIRLEKIVIGISLTAIVIVSAFNVVSTLMMMMHDRVKELSILKAMGFSASQSFRLFNRLGMFIGILGTILGLLGGVVVSLVARQTHWIRLPAEIYHIEYLPVMFRWFEMTLICFVSLLLSWVATLYPAIKIAMRSPLDGIRYE